MNTQITRRHIVFSLASAGLLALSGCGGGGNGTPAPRPQVLYDIVELPPLAGDFESGPTDMNEAGDVVGSSFGPDGPRATLWRSDQPNRPVNLGTLGTGETSIATGINAAGVVTGHSATNGPADTRGFRWENGTMALLAEPPQTAQTLPQAISANGRIAGTLLRQNDAVPTGIIWEITGQTQVIPSLPGSAFSLPQAIDSAGRIVGQTQTSGGVNAVHRGFLLDNGLIRELEPLPGGDRSSARGISENGWIVGWATGGATGGALRAVLWRDRGGAPEDLGALPGHAESTASDANTNGQIVGFSENDATQRRAFLWENGRMRDLNSLIPANSGWILMQATAINERGQITGYGIIGSQSRAFLLTPRGDGAVG